MNKRSGLKTFLSLLSTLFSLALSVFFIYLSLFKIFWFIPLAVYFALEGLFIFIARFIKDEYKAMRTLGIFQIIGVILLMVYLLAMALWNDQNQIIPYLLSYIVLGSSLFIKLLLALLEHIFIQKEYHPLLHGYRNNDLITAFYLILIIQLFITNQFFPGTGEGLLKEKPLWIYIIDVSFNAIFTILASLLALSTDIVAKEKENLTTLNKIKHTAKWFNDNEISMYFGLVFTIYLAALAIINVKSGWFYIFIAIYYLGTAFIRFINFLWHKGIQKRYKDNKIADNRWSSWILFFDAFAYLFFSNLLCAGALVMMAQKANVDSNIYLFIFFIIPFGIMRLIFAFKGIKANRRGNNTYRLGISLISLITAFFSILEITAIVCHNIPVFPRYFIIISMVVITKIVVIVIAIIFVIHWVRSLIINRRSKEKITAIKK